MLNCFIIHRVLKFCCHYYRQSKFIYTNINSALIFLYYFATNRSFEPSLGDTYYKHCSGISKFLPPPPHWCNSLNGPGPAHSIEASRSHSDKPHSVGFFWTSYQPDAENSIRQYSTLTNDQ